MPRFRLVGAKPLRRWDTFRDQGATEACWKRREACGAVVGLVWHKHFPKRSKKHGKTAAWGLDETNISIWTRQRIHNSRSVWCKWHETSWGPTPAPSPSPPPSAPHPEHPQIKMMLMITVVFKNKTLSTISHISWETKGSTDSDSVFPDLNPQDPSMCGRTLRRRPKPWGWTNTHKTSDEVQIRQSKMWYMANHQSIGATWYANGNWQEITVSQQHGDMRNISHAKIRPGGQKKSTACNPPILWKKTMLDAEAVGSHKFHRMQGKRQGIRSLCCHQRSWLLTECRQGTVQRCVQNKV